MKQKLFTLLTLALFFCSGAWADDDPTLSIGATTQTSSSFLTTYATEGITISSSASWSSGAVQIGNTASSYDQHYLQILSSTTAIEKVSFLLSGNGSDKTLQAPIFGWEDTPSSNTADTYYLPSEQTSTANSYKAAVWFDYDFSSYDVKFLRIYRQTKNISSTDPEYTGSSTGLGNGNTIKIWGIKIWLKSSGPVDPVFSLTKTSIGTDETSQIQVGTKGNLDGITFNGDVTFGTSGIVTVDASGVVTPVATGTTTINFNTNAVAEKYNAKNANSLSITVKNASNLALSSSSELIEKNGSAAAVTYTTSSTGTVSAVSSNTSVATVSVNTGTKTITITPVENATGSTTITVSQEADATYAAGEKTITVDVYNAAEYYTLSTKSETIALNKTNIDSQSYLSTTTSNWSSEMTIDGITDKFYEMSSAGRDLTLKAIGVSAFVVKNFNGGGSARTYGVSVNGGDAEVITVTAGATEDSHVFLTGTTGTVSITLKGQGTGTTRPAKIILYQDVTSLTPGHDKITYVTSDKLDFTNIDGLKAYVATAAGASGVTMTPVGTVPSKTPLLLVGTAGTTYNIPIVASADAPATNKLVAGDGTTDMSGVSGFNYILYSDGLFYQVTSGTIAATKAYLHLDSAPGAHALDIIFDESGEATGITEVTNGLQTKANGQYFNLAGQRVNTNHKGIVIVNGKKYFNK